MKLKWFILTAVICLIIGMLLAEPLFWYAKSLMPIGISFVALNATDGFMALMWIGLAISIALYGVILGLIGGFWVQDILYTKEKQFIAKSVLPASILFIIGFLFGGWLYTQIMLPYFIDVNNSLGLTNLLNFYSILINGILMCFLAGISFELPILLRGLIKSGLIEVNKFRGNRKFIAFGCMVIGAVVVPTPDILSGLLFALPLYGLFELGLWGL